MPAAVGYDAILEEFHEFSGVNFSNTCFNRNAYLVGFLQRPLNMKQFITSVVAALLLTLPAQAQQGMGIRAGVSADPGQFYFGGHAAFGPVVDKLWFRPNIEVGVGNSLTLIALNGEFAYWIPLHRNPWSIYLGGGPAANIFTSGFSGNRNSDVLPGFNVLVGIAQRKGFFSEVKIGAIDSPSFKFGIGYTFPVNQ